MATTVIFKLKNRHIFGERYCINVSLCPDIVWENGVPCVIPQLHHWRRQLFQIQKLSLLCNACVTVVKFLKYLNRHLKLHHSNKTANINGKNWPVYNLV